jgi:hypothetical protein
MGDQLLALFFSSGSISFSISSTSFPKISGAKDSCSAIADKRRAAATVLFVVMRRGGYVLPSFNGRRDFFRDLVLSQVIHRWPFDNRRELRAWQDCADGRELQFANQKGRVA